MNGTDAFVFGSGMIPLSIPQLFFKLHTLRGYEAGNDAIIRLPTLHLDSKVHGAIMGPTWGRQDPGGPHVGPMNFAIWAVMMQSWRTWAYIKHDSTEAEDIMITRNTPRAQNTIAPNLRNMKQSSHAWNGRSQNIPVLYQTYTENLIKIRSPVFP